MRSFFRTPFALTARPPVLGWPTSRVDWGTGRGGDAAGHLVTLTELVHLARMPLPRRLGLLEGMESDRFAEYARLAMLDHCHRTNPRSCTEADLEDLLDRAW